MTGGMTEHLDALEAAISKRPMTEQETAVIREITMAEQWCVSLFERAREMRTSGGYLAGSPEAERRADARLELDRCSLEFRTAFDRLKNVVVQPQCPWIGL